MERKTSIRTSFCEVKLVKPVKFPVVMVILFVAIESTRNCSQLDSKPLLKLLNVFHGFELRGTP